VIGDDRPVGITGRPIADPAEDEETT